ncbi:MAG TPA: lysoplasmalogenase [Candidatus Angelobacter sp.]|nr:lysoplasmalogenase [Candidatus Angelobacter sp.]
MSGGPREAAGTGGLYATTTIATILLALAAVAAVVDWYAVAVQRKPVEYVCKPLTLALLIGVALAVHPAYESRRSAFVVALVLSLLGDVFLMLRRDMFAFGLASFLLAHIAYVVGLRNGPSNTAALLVASVGVVVLAVTVGSRVLRGVIATGHQELTSPVVAYMAVLAAMFACALATLNPLAGLGAGLFFCSDAVLAWNRFVRPLRWGPPAVIVSYHLGQAFLVLSLLRR